MTGKIAIFLGLSMTSLVVGAEFPTADISNKAIKARLYLPDNEHGYYRGTRFDWSGVIQSLTYKGHQFFGVWFAHYEPTLHDAITGPVEEFRGADGGLGYAEAKPGGMFVKVGVGVLRKPDEPAYNFAETYQLVNPGHRVVRPGKDRVEFVHELNDGEGYSYVYTKTVRLLKNKPQLLLEHSLKNTGRRVIDTSVYNHDFYVMDNKVSGPHVKVEFAFEPKASADLKDMAEIEGRELVYKRELRPGGESVFSPLTGFGESAGDNDIRVENSEAGTGVRETGSLPISLLNFWSIRTTVCPEAYVKIHVEPGKTLKWRILYEFYELK